MASTRTQIIEKTCELLELQGYYATGINQIIDESQSPKGSLYYHFPGGKEQLATEALHHVGGIVLQRIRDNLALEPDPAIAIRNFIKNIAMNVESTEYRTGGPITAIAMETASTNETLRVECERIYRDWQTAFADKLIEANISETRAHRLSILILSAIEGGVLLCRIRKSIQPLDDVADEIAEILKL